MIRGFFRLFFRFFFWACAILGFTFATLIILFIIGFGPFSSAPKPLSQDSVLTLTLNGPYVEHRDSSGLEAFMLGQNASLYDITRALYQGAQDPKIKGLLLRIDTPLLGMAQIQELRDALLAFKKAGKSSWCYTDTFGELSSGTSFYYLATACNEIWVQPLGALNLTGLNAEVPFAKETLEKLAVKPELIQRKEYKSFVEMYTHKDFSEPSREAHQAVLDSILGQLVEGIAKERKLPHDQVRQLIAEGPYLGEAAKAAKLIDHIASYQQLKPAIEEKLGKSTAFTSLGSYLETLSEEKKGSKIALIFGSGIIQRDGGDSSFSGTIIGANATHKAFQSAISDTDVKAIVYRVNSQGGSPIASETIYSIIQYAKEQAKKPVIISMSDAAASGGYWISVAGSKIVAQPATLTGSIGVFGGKMVLSGLFEKLGLKWNHISTSENAMIWSPNESYTPSQWMKVNQWIDQIYEAFTARVAKARKLTPLQVEKVARGRVWTGEQALALGLVDQLGGLQSAFDLARKEANLAPDTPVVIYPKPLTFMEALTNFFESKEENTFLETGIFGSFFPFFRHIQAVISSVFVSEEVLYSPLLKIK
jgi:protease-4